MSEPVAIQGLFAFCFGGLLLRLAVLAHRGQVPRNRALVWSLLWGTGLLLVMNPDLSFYLAHVLGVRRGTDAVTYTAIAFLSVMIFRAFQLIDAQDRELSRLTTELALYQWQTARGARPEPDKQRVGDPPGQVEEAPA